MEAKVIGLVITVVLIVVLAVLLIARLRKNSDDTHGTIHVD